MLAAALLPAAGASAAGGSFACKDMQYREITANVSGSSTFISIAKQYMARWDAVEVRRQCENYAAGRPYQISCLMGRRDWDAIRTSIPREYFGQSDKSLAQTYRNEMNAGNGYGEAMDYCRSVGAIK